FRRFTDDRAPTSLQRDGETDDRFAVSHGPPGHPGWLSLEPNHGRPGRTDLSRLDSARRGTKQRTTCGYPGLSVSIEHPEQQYDNSHNRGEFCAESKLLSRAVGPRSALDFGLT